jgi:hypothetical protein
MLKKYSIVLLFVLFSVTLYSQGIRLGLGLNPQLSWLKSDLETVKSDGPVMGFSFGVLSDFFFAERYSFSTGLFINNTGGKLMHSDTIDFETNKSTYELLPTSLIKYKIQYIEVPLSLRMESNKIGYFVYNAQFGLTNQFRINASSDIESDNPTASFSVTGAGCDNEVSFYNLSYNIGAGFDYYFSKNTALSLGIIYTNGFLDVTSNSLNDKVSLRSIALRIGVLF